MIGTILGVVIATQVTDLVGGVLNISRTLKASQHDACVMEIVPRCKCVGMLGGKYENAHDSNRRVYDPEYCSPTLTTCGGGRQKVKIIEPMAYDEQNNTIRLDTVGTLTTDGSSPKHNNRIIEPKVQYVGNVNPSGHGMNGDVISDSGVAKTITTNKGEGQKVLIEPQVLTPKRTEHGKQVRKAYETGKHKESRHTMTQLEPRNDGISNTLTTVQKDNYLVEPCGAAIRGRSPNNPSDRTAGIPTEQMLEVKNDGTANCVTTVQKDCMVVEPEFRVRKITPREAYRLMNFSDEDFDKASAVNSSSQLYRQAGNSICVNVLMAIFSEIDIDIKE